jgi:hypothetical protein
VNVMKCSKNVLGLILVACECVGERANTYLMPSPADIHDGNDDDDTRLPMQLPLTLRSICLQRHELRGGGGGLSVLAALTSENVCQRR